MSESKNKQRLGATGEFPNGKLNAADEGELRIGITHEPGGNVILHFGKPVAWLGLPPEQAIELGELLIKHGRGEA